MRDGSAGKYGNPGNEESATYRLPDRPGGSNPTLTAQNRIVANVVHRNMPSDFGSFQPFFKLLG